MRVLSQALAAIVGPDHVLDSTDEREEYAFDAFSPEKAREFLGGPPPLPLVIARPGSTREVQEIVRLANRTQTPIVPFGGGTGVMGAAVPVRAGIVLDMKRMRRLLHADPGGMIARVEAGMVLADLDSALNQEGLMLGHDPWSQAIATVGGAISTNGVGYLAAGYGTMGEQVLGLEVVLPQGDLLRARAVSTGAGAGLHRVCIGAEGVFGVITAATLRVFPLPERRVLLGLAFPDFASGYRAILEMGRRGLRPSMVDYTEEPDAGNARLQPGSGGPPQCRLFLAFDGLEDVVRAQEALAVKICAASSGQDLGRGEAQGFWGERHATAEAWQRRNAGGRRFARSHSWTGGRWFDYLHLALPPDRVLEYRARCETMIAEAGLAAREYAIWGRPDLFSVVITAPPPRPLPLQPPLPLPALSLPKGVPEAGEGGGEGPSAQAGPQLSHALLSLAQSMGGSMEYCHGVGLKLRSLMAQELGPGLDALRSVKRALDPHGIMNPGKLGL